MNIYKVKQMYDVSKELDCKTQLFKHHIKEREEAQDIIKCLSKAIGLPYAEIKSNDRKSGWFVIEESNFNFTIFFELSQEEREAFKPREVLV